jgi:hypothetical protein
MAISFQMAHTLQKIWRNCFSLSVPSFVIIAASSEKVDTFIVDVVTDFLPFPVKVKGGFHGCPHGIIG